ncbi:MULTISPECIES: Na+/H+ antiporter NhaC family protein [Pontibacillus]|uniref:Na+/H+ antiporter NhaC family protein n=1 Tax=Pontibacillus chungwhensis TaxID=265426 RepID=A0ABY8UW80_9BACI|nr:MULTISPECIES: Na+/H+ antiporter NhaC family protein [Pontibacillus]MCD5324000.1 sodium:proton antiporter [Pontibacillus sp. HN14]WIF97937.1 Na+/H+ antiporter NhaC family protein [Pontibacillus chungwhensis]
MNWFSIIPFIVVVITAIATKQVIPSLFFGVVVAGYLVTPDWLGGMTQALEFVIKGLSDPNNLKIIIFLYAFSGLIGLVRISGGIKGFVQTATEKISGRKGAFALTWLSALGTFSAPSFRIVTIAPVMKAMVKKLPMTKQELGFVIETTASPFVVLVPVATAFVGYMSSVIGMAMDQNGIEGDPYMFFLRSIPFNFFAISMILIGFYLSFFHKSKKQATDAENSKAEEEKEGEDDDDQWEDCHPSVSKDLPSNFWHLILPLASVIIFTFFFMYMLGVKKEGAQGFEALINANVLDAMVLAVVLSIAWFIIYLKIRSYPLRKQMNELIEGGNEMMSVILLLAMVWGLSKGSEALNFAQTISESLQWIPASFVAVLVFLIGCALSYFIGSSWGTWGILMPVGVSIAAVSGSSLPIVIGAVFASGTFGAFSSPLSDNTNTTAGILNLNAVRYAKFKFKPAAIAAGVASVLYLALPFFL